MRLSNLWRATISGFSPRGLLNIINFNRNRKLHEVQELSGAKSANQRANIHLLIIAIKEKEEVVTLCTQMYGSGELCVREN